MTILNMTATFGALENQTLTLKPGLNILTLPNEGGKSTWCAFLRAMLYGVETRKGRELSEKNRFTPWSGKPMAGTMDLLWRGTAITLRRFPKGPSPFGGFQAVYTGTEEPVPGLTADNAGQTLLGFGKEVFERTCFIGQGGMAFGPSAELEQRLAALASSGEEDVSFSKTEATLRTWRNALQSNRANGSIPQAQAQRDALKAQLARLDTLERTVREAGAREAELLRRQEALQAQLEDLAARKEAAFQQEYAAAQDKLTQAAAQRSTFPTLPFAAALFALAAALVLLVTGLGLFAAAALAVGVILLGLAFSLRRRNEDARQSRIDAAQEALSQLARQSGGDPPDAAQLRSQLSSVSQALADLRTRQAQAAGELRALGDPDGLRERLSALTAQIAADQERYDALTAAMEALTAANAQLQLRFSPAVSALAGEILAKLTANRYDSLTFTRAFEALAGAQGQPGRSAALLSQGTADQAYLALRLAVCLLALPQDGPAPLVLDDALVTFDDRRLALALGVLSDFAQNRQVLLFTCQSREETAMISFRAANPD